MTQVAELPDRGVIAVTGDDRVTFLQGLVSNDVSAAATGHAVWAALLTPQGKWLADFFVLADGERLLLDCERAQMEMLVTRLSRFRLRAKVAIAPTGLCVLAAWSGAPGLGPLTFPDPRLAAAGWRILSEVALATNADGAAWDRHRLSLGLPDGSRDMEAEKTVLLEAGFDELGGISWTKGCYMGQELTARTRYRGLLKRRLVPVNIAGEIPPPGAPVLRGGVEVGTMRSARDGVGLAVLRLEALAAERLECGAATLAPRVPDWMRGRRLSVYQPFTRGQTATTSGPPSVTK
jgi:folate-binding protein YgfZ